MWKKSFQNFFFENDNATIVIWLVIIYVLHYVFSRMTTGPPFKSLNWSRMILAYFGGIEFDAECNVSGHWQ